MDGLNNLRVQIKYWVNIAEAISFGSNAIGKLYPFKLNFEILFLT